MVIHRHGQHLLGIVLTYDVLVEKSLDGSRLGHRIHIDSFGLSQTFAIVTDRVAILLQHSVEAVYALGAYICTLICRRNNHLAHVGGSPTKRTHNGFRFLFLIGWIIDWHLSCWL